MSAAKENPAHGGNRSGAGTSNQSAADSTAPVNRLLQALSGVKATGPDRWIAKCPSHADRRPSLTIRELPDGTILLKCWAGCGASDVMAAAGLGLADLFPKPLPDRGPLRPRERWDRSDVWQLLVHEAGIAAIGAADAAAGRSVTPEDAVRVGLAADRLSDAARALGVTP